MIISNIFRSRPTASRVLMVLLEVAAICAIQLAAYVGVQEPATSQPPVYHLPESQPSTPSTPPELEPTPTTGQPHLAHAAPSLVAPKEGAVFSGSGALGVRLVWRSDKNLDESEEFYIQISCRSSGRWIRAERWTRRTQLTLRWLEQMDCDSDRHFWTVTIYRVGRTTSSGQRIGTPSSPASSTRSFIWRRIRPTGS